MTERQGVLAALSSLLIASLCLGVQAAASQDPRSVWSIDFVRAKPGLRADYLEFSRLNWALVREEMKRDGVVRSFMVLTAAPGGEGKAPSGGWDIMLVTEYASRAAYDAREEAYQRAVARIRRPGEPWPRLVNGRAARALADIVESTLLDAFPLAGR